MDSNSCFLLVGVIDLLSAWHSYSAHHSAVLSSLAEEIYAINLCNKTNSERLAFPQRVHKSFKGI